MPKPQRVPPFDLSAIHFPTDQITFGQLRKLYPELFTTVGVLHGHPEKILPLGALHLELSLAHKAFAVAAGMPDPHPDDDRRESILMLNADYLRYGISSGLQQTRQMIMAFESEAAKQAKSAFTIARREAG